MCTNFDLTATLQVHSEQCVRRDRILLHVIINAYMLTMWPFSIKYRPQFLVFNEKNAPPGSCDAT